MTSIELCNLGVDELIGKYRSGQLGVRHLWVAMRGADKYRRAVAAGDITDDLTAELRAKVCLACQTTTATGPDHERRHWCGEPFAEVPGASCGCLVALTVGGEIVPAAKTAVGSERCPQRKW